LKKKDAIDLTETAFCEELLFAHGLCYKGEGVADKNDSRIATAKETIRAAIDLRYSKASIEQTSKLTSATAQLEIAINQMAEANQINRNQIEEQRRIWQESKLKQTV
jgi:flagellar biosynthesis chaperone FliJ